MGVVRGKKANVEISTGAIYTKYARDPYSSKYSPAKLTLCVHIFLEKYINFQETFIQHKQCMCKFLTLISVIITNLEYGKSPHSRLSYIQLFRYMGGHNTQSIYSVTCNEKPYQESIAASVAVSETENSSDKIRKFQSTKKREIYSCEKQ